MAKMWPDLFFLNQLTPSSPFHQDTTRCLFLEPMTPRSMTACFC